MRRRGPERDAERLAEAFEQRQHDLAQREEELQAAESAAEQETSAANLARGLDEITESEHAERIAAADRRVAEARAARDSTRDVLIEVARAAADAAEAVEQAKVEAAITDVQRLAQAREAATEALVKLEADEALAEERLATVERWAKDARAPFDPAVAAEAERRAKKDQSHVFFHAGEMHKPDDPAVKPWLREPLAAEIARRERENAEYRERLRERSDRVDTHSDPNTIAMGEPFPTAEVR